MRVPPVPSPGNVLLLRGAISIHSDVSAVTVEDLIQQVADYLLSSNQQVCVYARALPPSLPTITLTGIIV